MYYETGSLCGDSPWFLYGRSWSGVDALEAATILGDGLIDFLGSVGLQLRKCMSNEINLISDLSVDVNDG